MNPTRSGRFIKQVEGHRAFHPVPLPPAEPPLEIDTEMIHLLTEADRSLGRLDGVTSILPNPDLFVAMYVKQEAVLSSQIEGTQSTLDDVLQFTLDAKGEEVAKDVGEVVNYVAAMNHGLKRIKDLPLSKRLIREIHAELLRNVRGGNKEIGSFRRSQNWIGPAGCTLANATFVPPPVHVMQSALDALEKFLHNTSLPVLLHCGLVHAQFETIHPFLDGNGRIGRLLITFLLCQRDVLHKPLLYLSAYLKRRRAEYYDRLTAVREGGDWEGWLKFFLRGIDEVSREAVDTAWKILDLRERHRAKLRKADANAKALHLLDYLCQQPIFTIKTAADFLDCAIGTAASLIDEFQRLKFVKEMTGHGRNRRWRYGPYLELFESAKRDPDAARHAAPSRRRKRASLARR